MVTIILTICTYFIVYTFESAIVVSTTFCIFNYVKSFGIF